MNFLYRNINLILGVIIFLIILLYVIDIFPIVITIVLLIITAFFGKYIKNKKEMIIQINDLVLDKSIDI